MNYSIEHTLYPTIDDLIAIRPDPVDAVAMAIAKTEIQERILRTVIKAGDEGILTSDLAETLHEPFTHVQRVANVIRYERSPRYPILRRYTNHHVVLDTEEYGIALKEVEAIAERAEDSLRALGDHALRTTLELATIDTRSASTTGRNLETVKLLLAHAGLPVSKWHLLARYRTLGLLDQGQEDGNFYRRLNYMKRQPLFARIITVTANSNSPSYSIEPEDLDAARNAGLINPPPSADKTPSPPKKAPPIREMTVRKPKPVVASKLKPAPTPPAPKNPIDSQPNPTSGPVHITGLSEEESHIAQLLIGKLKDSRKPVKVSSVERGLLDRVARQYTMQTGAVLVNESSQGKGVSMGILARRSNHLIFYK